jgi:hypothetical protein
MRQCGESLQQLRSSLVELNRELPGDLQLPELGKLDLEVDNLL